MTEQRIETHAVDVRGLFGPDAMLKVESTADGLPGKVVDVLSDNPCFTIDLLRWCGDGYGLILEATCGRDGDRFLVAVPNRDEAGHQRLPARAAAA